MELLSRLLLRNSQSRRRSGAQSRCQRAAPHIAAGIAIQIRRVRLEDSPICTWLTIWSHPPRRAAVNSSWGRAGTIPALRPTAISDT